MTANPADLPLIAGRIFAERYRLDTVLASTAAAPTNDDNQVGQFWLAYDEVLARPVAVLLVARDHPRVEAVLAQARAAARLAHPSLVRVYDAGEADGHAFVVTEYLSGGSLEDRLQSGPMEAVAAVELVVQIGSGVAEANAIGLSRFDASPRTVLFTGAGEARLTGLGSSGVSGGADELIVGESGERADTVALADLLYATLTSRWPGRPGSSSLPSAPIVDGHLRPPGLVRGGLPRDVDTIVVQALGDATQRRGLEAIDSPADLVAALSEQAGSDAPSDVYAADVALDAAGQSARGSGRGGWWRPHLPAARRARIAALAVLLVMALAVIQFARVGPSNYLHFSVPTTVTDPTATPTPVASPTAAATTNPTTTAAVAIAVRSVVEFDPYGDHKDPHLAEAKLATDGNPATAWKTQTYRSAALGNLKPGVGLLVDLGSADLVGAVTVDLLGSGTSVELFASAADVPPTKETAMTEVATQTATASSIVLRPPVGTTGRYWLVWLTRLPAVKAGFQGGIAELAFAPPMIGSGSAPAT